MSMCEVESLLEGWLLYRGSSVFLCNLGPRRLAVFEVAA